MPRTSSSWTSPMRSRGIVPGATPTVPDRARLAREARVGDRQADPARICALLRSRRYRRWRRAACRTHRRRRRNDPACRDRSSPCRLWPAPRPRRPPPPEARAWRDPRPPAVSTTANRTGRAQASDGTAPFAAPVARARLAARIRARQSASVSAARSRATFGSRSSASIWLPVSKLSSTTNFSFAAFRWLTRPATSRCR